MAMVAASFVLVAAVAGNKGHAVNTDPARRYLIGVLLALGVVIAFSTLRAAAGVAGSAQAPAAIVKVVAHQWRWELSTTEVPVGRPVLFEVTASDVNHGLGIYRAKQRLIGQVQAMPGYVNRLTVRFDEPGDYELLCLEYCGLVHHGMTAKVTAK